MKGEKGQKEKKKTRKKRRAKQSKANVRSSTSTLLFSVPLKDLVSQRIGFFTRQGTGADGSRMFCIYSSRDPPLKRFKTVFFFCYKRFDL